MRKFQLPLMRSLNSVFTSFPPRRIFVLNVRRPAYRGCNTDHRGCCQCQTIRDHLLLRINSTFATLLATNFHPSLGSFLSYPLFSNIYNTFGSSDIRLSPDSASPLRRHVCAPAGVAVAAAPASGDPVPGS